MAHPFTATNRGLMIDTKLVSWALALWGALAFVVCVLYGLITPRSLHMAPFLEQILPGFRWLTWPSFAIGLFESFVYGAYAGLTFSIIYNRLHGRRSRPLA